MFAGLPCEYCGLPANGIDHVPSQAARPRILEMGLGLKVPFFTVPACVWCNSHLGDRGLWTLSARKRYIKRLLRKKFKRLLATPVWSDDDLARLGRTLRSKVIADLRYKALIEERLRW